MIQDSAENLTPLAHAAQNRCFGCGPANEHGLHLTFLLAADAIVVCNTAVSGVFDGHPGYLHGGIIATLLDETMSKTVRARGLTSMTRHLEVDYLRPVPSSKPIRMEGRITRSEGRKHWVEAHILGSDGTRLAHAKGLFVELRQRGTT